MTKVGTTEISFFQPSTAQVRMTEVGTAEIGSVQLSSKQDSTTQINPWQFSISQAGAIHSNSTEIPLPSSITLQQLLSSHNPNIQNTTVAAWTDFSQTFTSFDLKLEVLDLATGQLAEATIIG